MGIIQKKCSICGKVFTTLDNKSKYCSARAKPMTKQQLEAAGFKEANGIYDTRDWNTIRNWAEELATAVYRTGKSTRALSPFAVFSASVLMTCGRIPMHKIVQDMMKNF